MSLISRFAICGVACAIGSSPVLAQTPVLVPVQLTSADYEHAENFLSYKTAPLVLRAGVRASWLPGDPSDRFWYRVTTEKGVETILVDPGRALKASCDLAPCKAAEGEEAARGAGIGGKYAEMSPDRTRTAFVRDWNLWVRDVASGRETQLTRDGEKDFGYATDNAGWARSERPILRWSPDSKKIATFQQDQRGVGEMYLVDTNVGHPACRRGSIRCPATRRYHDPARRHRGRHRKDGPAEPATGSASLHAVRRRGVPRRMG